MMHKRLKDLKLEEREELKGLRVFYSKRKYKTARGRLAAFLSDLDPLFRRLLTGDHLNAFDNIDFEQSDARRRRHVRQAERQYFRLLREVCNEGTRDDETVNREFLDNGRREAILYETPPTAPGRRPQAVGRSRDVAVSREAEKAMSRLKPGFLRAQAIKREGGHRSDASVIRKMLWDSAQAYRGAEIEAIVKSHSLPAAAARYLAWWYRRPFPSIKAAISRGARLRRGISPQRRRNR